jgi:DNA-binding NarL/FixJ family response regulator
MLDDHTLVRAGIRAWSEKLPEVEVVGEASDGRRENLRWGNAPRLTPFIAQAILQRMMVVL